MGYIIIGIIILAICSRKVKCPKCEKECSESYYAPGIVDSMYYECPDHGNINKLK